MKLSKNFRGSSLGIPLKSMALPRGNEKEKCDFVLEATGDCSLHPLVPYTILSSVLYRILFSLHSSSSLVCLEPLANAVTSANFG